MIVVGSFYLYEDGAVFGEIYHGNCAHHGTKMSGVCQFFVLLRHYPFLSFSCVLSNTVCVCYVARPVHKPTHNHQPLPSQCEFRAHYYLFLGKTTSHTTHPIPPPGQGET